MRVGLAAVIIAASALWMVDGEAAAEASGGLAPRRAPRMSVELGARTIWRADTELEPDSVIERDGSESDARRVRRTAPETR